MDFFASIRDGIAGFGPDQWVGVGSALIAAVSFFFNWRLVRRQEKRQSTTLKLAYDSDVIGWSDDVVEVLAHADEMLKEKGLSYADADFAKQRSKARADLSALIDKGRLFFPNVTDGDHGIEKEAGYQGRRQPALDQLVQAYAVLDTAGDKPGPAREASEQLMKHRRAFMAEIFQAVDPVRRGMTLKELSI